MAVSKAEEDTCDVEHLHDELNALLEGWVSREEKLIGVVHTLVVALAGIVEVQEEPETMFLQIVEEMGAQSGLNPVIEEVGPRPSTSKAASKH
jgi:hypothetical protein